MDDIANSDWLVCYFSKFFAVLFGLDYFLDMVSLHHYLLPNLRTEIEFLFIDLWLKFETPDKVGHGFTV